MARVLDRSPLSPGLGFGYSATTYQEGTHRPAEQLREGIAAARARRAAGLERWAPPWNARAARQLGAVDSTAAGEGIPPGGSPAPPVPSSAPTTSAAGAAMSPSDATTILVRKALIVGAVAGAGATTIVALTIALMSNRRRKS